MIYVIDGLPNNKGSRPLHAKLCILFITYFMLKKMLKSFGSTCKSLDSLVFEFKLVHTMRGYFDQNVFVIQSKITYSQVLFLSPTSHTGTALIF